MASIKVKFRSSALSHKEGVIYYQIISERKVKLITSGFKLYPHEWDKKRNRVICETRDYKRESYLQSIENGINHEYNVLLQIIDMLKSNGEDVIEKVGEYYKNHTLNGTLFPFMKNCIEELLREDREKTASTYLTALRSFSNFRNNIDLRFENLDGRLMKEYEAWLKRRNVTLNTISFYMRILRAVYNRAVDMGLTRQNMPFKGVYTGIEKTTKRAVDANVISKLKNLDLSSSYHLMFARDMFMFSFYTRGMAFVDMAQLSRKNIVNGYLVYTRSKTGQQLTIKLEPCMKEILNRYAHLTDGKGLLFPIVTEKLKYRSALRVHNSRLKTISTMLGLPRPITSYVSRHSWASFAKKTGVPIQVISEGMGHDNENTTRIYLASLDQSVIDRTNKRLLSKI